MNFISRSVSLTDPPAPKEKHQPIHGDPSEIIGGTLPKTETFASTVFRLPVSTKNLVAALLAGLLLRLFFVVHFPFSAGDTKFYDALARNWLDHRVYGLFVNGQLMPVDMRVPGYPAFLASVYAIFGRAREPVLVVQAAVDLAACILTAIIAARVAPVSKQRAVATAALWMAALCPFTANYASALLTETLAIFFTALALLIFVCILDHPWLTQPVPAANHDLWSFVRWIFLGGVLVGMGTLIRPEAPLILLATGLVLCIRLRRRTDWSKLILAVAWMAVGLLLPLTPWAMRNARTLGRIEFLAPRYAETAGDFIPRGFFAWTRTWMIRYQDAYLVPWKLGNAPILVDTLPPGVFDSAEEHARVTALLDDYNSTLRIPPMLDRQFEILASERIARHPFRSRVLIPLERVWTMWSAPRVQLLRYSGELSPFRQRWRDHPTQFDVTLGFKLLDLLYIALAAAGAWRCRKRPALLLLVTFIIIRTAFLTQLQTVEPRYVIVCFPALLAIGAQALVNSPQFRESAAAEWVPGRAATAD